MHVGAHPLVLWDIDGTLVRGNGLIASYFLRALGEVYNIAEPQRISYGGKTDQQIVAETLALHGISDADALAAFDRWSTHYHGLLTAALHELPQALRVLPGVQAVLEQLQQRGVPQSLLTGNIAPVAAIKLEATGLARFVDMEIGAYGSDHRDRNALVPIARRKAEARYGPIDRVVVVGDTPLDIACARAGNARAVAVATGHVPLEALAEHRPDALLPDLSNTGAVIAAILNNEPIMNEQ
jgi:phosphoglycolate phosphatase-like HAD superfamily hydrolase